LVTSDGGHLPSRWAPRPHSPCSDSSSRGPSGEPREVMPGPRRARPPPAGLRWRPRKRGGGRRGRGDLGPDSPQGRTAGVPGSGRPSRRQEPRPQLPTRDSRGRAAHRPLARSVSTATAAPARRLAARHLRAPPPAAPDSRGSSSPPSLPAERWRRPRHLRARRWLLPPASPPARPSEVF
jgi:hypothetical protein